MMCNGNKYFWRQSIILFTSVLFGFSVGVMLAYPSAVTPSLLASNGTDIAITIDQASWLAACNGLAGVIGVFILPPIMQAFGRKALTIIIHIQLMIGWIIFVIAKDISSLFLSRIIQGITLGGTMAVTIILGEYVNPRRRGYFVIIMKLSMTIGILFCHSMTIFLTWRQMAGCLIAINFMGLLVSIFLPESPSFLAIKGRFDDCEKAYKWLHGQENRNELTDMINARKEEMEKQKYMQKKVIWKILKTFSKQEFRKAVIITILLCVILECCGRHYFAIYVKVIMLDLIRNESLAVYCSITFDCLVVLAFMSSCVIVRRFNRRKILFSFSIITVAIMYLLSLLIFMKFTAFAEWTWLTPSLVLIFSFVANAGVIPVCFSILGEIYSLELRGLGASTTGLTITSMHGIILKITPVLISAVRLEGTFVIYGACVLISLSLLYFVLPETKDKTLQEIEREIKGTAKRSGEIQPMLEH